MLYQNESTKRLVATASFYSKIKRARGPVFLHRNLNQVLDDHAEKLQDQELFASVKDPESSSHKDETHSTPQDSEVWIYSLGRNMLDELAKRRHSVLKVDVRGLRVEDATLQKEILQDGRPHKRQRLPRVQCQIEVAIYVKDPLKPGDKAIVNIYKQQRPATLDPRPRQSEHLMFDIDMGGPLFIDVETLYLAMQVGPKWRRAISTADYSLRCNFHLASSDDAAILMPFFGSSQPPQLGAFIRSRYSDLPRCPAPGEGMAAVPNWGTKTGKKNHVLDIDMSWSNPLTILETNNQQLPTPESSSISSQPTTRDVRVSYELKNQVPPKKLEYDAPVCYLCSRKDYGTFEKLVWHLRNYHDLLHFDIGEPETWGLDGARVSIVVNSSDRYRSKDDSFEKSWVAPQRPFDLVKYIKGDRSWVNATSADRKRNNARGGAPMITVEKVPVRASDQRRGEDVQDLPPMRREKHKIPAPPKNVSFFRTISKRPVAEGDLVSESDDDVENTWLSIKQNRGVTALSTPSVAAQNAEIVFMRSLNDYTQRERPSGDLCAGDTLVRFVKQNRNGQLFKSKHVRAAFRKKAVELRDDRIISQSVYERSLQELRLRPRPVANGHQDLEEQLASIHCHNPRAAESLAHISQKYVDTLRENKEERSMFFKKVENLKKDGKINEKTFRDYVKLLGKGTASTPVSNGQVRPSGLGDSELDKFKDRLETIKLVCDSQDSDREIAIFLLNLQEEHDPPDICFKRLLRLPEPGRASHKPAHVQRLHRLEWALNKFLAQLGRNDPKCNRDMFMKHLKDIESQLGRLRKSGREASTSTPVSEAEDGDLEMLDEVVVQSADPGPNYDVEDSISSDDDECDMSSQSEEAWRPRCVCGQVLDTAITRDIITCANPDCPKPDFHVSCVDAVRRSTDWKCDSCRSSS